MIILGNVKFATAMKLAGVKESHIIRKPQDAVPLLEKCDKDEFIIANVSVYDLVPELAEFKNVVTLPDDPKAFGTTDDLKGIIKSAVGIEINL